MSITRGDIKAKIKRRIGDTSGFYATDFYNDVIDSRVRTWAGLVCRLSPNYYIKHESFTGVDDAVDSSHEFYALPTDFRTFVKLERQFGTGLGTVFQTVPLINAEDQDRYHIANFTLLALPDSLTNYEQVVSIWDTRFRLVPAPVSNSYQYRFKYIRKPVDASADESTLDIPEEWQEVVILDSAIFILAQLGDPIAGDIRKLLATEVIMLKSEYRRRNMGIGGVLEIRETG